MFDRAKLIAQLQPEEGERFFVYDDKTGKKIGPGSKVVGEPTIAIGHALNLTPFTHEQNLIILGWDVDAKTVELYQTFPWLKDHSEPVQRGVADMEFNLGISKLENFATFLTLLTAREYAKAADDLSHTLWDTQVGARADAIEALIRGG